MYVIRITKIILPVLLGTLLLDACAKTEHRENRENLSKAVSLKWNKNEVIGLNLSLDDPVQIENLRFTKYGDIQADFGCKNGPVCGPILSWKVSSGRLFIQGSEVILLSRSPTTIIVKNSDGKIQKFKIEKNLYP